jgi:hypothetical protein
MRKLPKIQCDRHGKSAPCIVCKHLLGPERGLRYYAVSPGFPARGRTAYRHVAVRARSPPCCISSPRRCRSTQSRTRAFQVTVRPDSMDRRWARSFNRSNVPGENLTLVSTFRMMSLQ